MKKRICLAAIVVLALILLLPLPALAHTAESPYTTILLAGQYTEVGDLHVWNDGTNLYVQYACYPNWIMTKTHLYVGKTDIATLSNAPGQFPYSEDHGPGISTYTYTIPLSSIDSYSMPKGKNWKADGTPGVWITDTIYVAAHAVVYNIIGAPYYGSEVIDYWQGTQKSGAPVRWQRSDPEQGLEFEPGQSEFNFFSLGFGGWITIGYDYPILNGDGYDIKVIEDTWGSYPLEQADVYVSEDGETWYYIGTADNLTRDVLGIHSIYYFDLGTLGQATYVKVVDTTYPCVHGGTADGYDLNAVEALHDYQISGPETAWGLGVRFSNNWAMAFTYQVQ